MQLQKGFHVVWDTKIVPLTDKLKTDQVVNCEYYAHFLDYLMETIVRPDLGLKENELSIGQCVSENKICHNGKMIPTIHQTSVLSDFHLFLNLQNFLLENALDQLEMNI